jgi:hypothetical protein
VRGQVAISACDAIAHSSTASNSRPHRSAKSTEMCSRSGNGPPSFRYSSSWARPTTINGFGDEQPVYRFHGGQTVSADVALGILLGEFIVHGHDIAGALRRDWPIEPAHVELVMRGLTPVLPGWLDPSRSRGHTGRYEVRLRGQGAHRFAFDNGSLRMNPPGPFRPDVVISADAPTFVLVVYKRIRQWPAILTGRLAAYGRRPWLAPGFAGRFHQP